MQASDPISLRRSNSNARGRGRRVLHRRRGGFARERSSMKSIVRVLSTATVAVAPALCLAQIVRVEVYPIESVTMSDQDFLNGRKDAKPVTLAGQLKIPRAGNERLPAVVLLHGSGGVGGNLLDWENDLNQRAIPAFVRDAFPGRGIPSTSVNQALLIWLRSFSQSRRLPPT